VVRFGKHEVEPPALSSDAGHQLARLSAGAGISIIGL